MTNPQQTIMEQFKVIEDAVRELKDMMNYEAKEDLLDSIRADADDEDKRDAQEAEEKADDSESNTSFY